jgi:hypothetical protein
MMTWMTRMSFFDTAQDLDVDLLSTGYRDAVQLFNALLFEQDEISENHPVLRMWQGYHVALASYAISLSASLVVHGISHGTEALRLARTIEDMRREEDHPFVLPPWLEDTDVLRSHRSNIVRRWPEYADVWPKTPELLPYLYPFVEDEGGYALMVSKHDKELIAQGERKLPKAIAQKVANL